MASRAASSPARRRRCTSWAWASSAARSSMSRPTSTSFRLPGGRRDRRGTRPLSNHEFFARLARRLIAALVGDHRGRLRVPGRHAAATVRRKRAPRRRASTCSSTYLITQGREWERYAWIKARALTGDRGRRARRTRAPVRLPALPRLQRVRVHARSSRADPRARSTRRDFAENIKLGPGGIREIEFIVQAFQLIRGGREPALRERGRRCASARRWPSADCCRGGGAAELTRRLCFPAQPRAPAAVSRRRQTHDAAAGGRRSGTASRRAWVRRSRRTANAALDAHRAARSSRHFDEIFAASTDSRRRRCWQAICAGRRRARRREPRRAAARPRAMPSLADSAAALRALRRSAQYR